MEGPFVEAVIIVVLAVLFVVLYEVCAAIDGLFRRIGRWMGHGH